MIQMKHILPVPKKRVRYFRRYGREEYIRWISDYLNRPAPPTLEDYTRPAIDQYFMNDYKPAWVEAAEKTMETTQEEVDAEYEEKWQETKERMSSNWEPLDMPFNETETDYNSWTIRELQEECRQRGITIRGTKAEVVLRLRRHDEGLTTQTEENETEAPSEEAAEESSDAPSEEAVTPEVNENATDSEQGEYTDEEE